LWRKGRIEDQEGEETDDERKKKQQIKEKYKNGEKDRECVQREQQEGV
jgi:hypothetical protein